MPTYSHACDALNASPVVPPLPLLTTHDATRIPLTVAMYAQNSVVLSECLVSVVNRVERRPTREPVRSAPSTRAAMMPPDTKGADPTPAPRPRRCPPAQHPKPPEDASPTM